MSADKQLECQSCGKYFPLPLFASHSNSCGQLQAPTSGPSFHAADDPITLTEEQREEVEALQSILEDDFDFTEAAALLVLTVRAPGTRVKLLVRYTQHYPAEPPKLAVQRLDNNISRERSTQLYQHLRDAAEELAKHRSAFVLELYYAALQFLEEVEATASSLHDQFLRKQQQRQEETKEGPSPAKAAKSRWPMKASEVAEEEAFEARLKAEMDAFATQSKDSNSPPDSQVTHSASEGYDVVDALYEAQREEDEEQEEEEEEEEEDEEHAEDEEETETTEETSQEKGEEASSGGLGGHSSSVNSASTAIHQRAVVAKEDTELRLRRHAMLVHLLRLYCTKHHPNDPSAEAQLKRDFVRLGLLDRRTPFDSATFQRLFRDHVQAAKRSAALTAPFWATRYTPDRAAAAVPHSRYLNDFEEIRKLGEGAYGRVVKVRNKLDMRLYAIKQIHLLPRKQNGEPKYNERIMREVSLLSRLYHQHIVRYYNAWIEDSEVETEDDSSIEHWQSDMFTFTRSDHSTSSESGSESKSDSEEDWGPESSPTPEMDNEAMANPFSRRRSSDALASGSRTLYLQMEYCLPTTLRSAINKQAFVNNVEAAYRVLRQILEALVFIHSKGVVHRDLKPENIFFHCDLHSGAAFYEGDIKIGDFGLATDGTTPAGPPDPDRDLPRRPKPKPKPKGRGVFEYSAGVGTRTYCAPEQEKSRNYNEKVDIFSVGILFLEMLAGFGTEHERCLTLAAVRETGRATPEFYAKCPREAELVNVCVTHSPERRWSARQLLESDRLPKPPAEDSAIRQVMDTVTSDRASPHFQRLLGSLFSSASSGLKDYMAGFQKPGPPQQVLGVDAHAAYDKALSTLMNVCHQHSFLHIPCPSVIPHLVTASEPSGTVFLTRNADLVSLPSNPVVAWSYHLALPAQQHVTALKRYGVQSRPAPHAPGAEGAVLCLDVVAPLDSSPGPDAELLEVLAEALLAASLPEACKPQFRVSHAQIAEELLSLCGVPEPCRAEVAAAVDGLAGSTWQAVKRRVQPHVEDRLLRVLREVAHIQAALEDPAAVRKAADDALEAFRKAGAGPDALASVERAFGDLFALGEVVGALGLAVPVVVDLGCLADYATYCGVLLQAGLQGRTFEVVARGGRYDNLLQRLRARQHRLLQCSGARRLPPLPEVIACGVQVDVARLAEGAAGDKARRESAAGGVEVAVCSGGVLDTAEYLREAFPAAKALRAWGLRVSVLYDSAAAGDALKEHLKRLQPAWVLFVKPTGPWTLSSFTHRVSREVGRDHLGKVVHAMVRGAKDRPGSAHHESGAEAEEAEEARGDLGLQVTVLPATFRTADMSASVRRQLVSCCLRAFQSAIRPQLPNCLVLYCGLSFLDVRTAVSVFHGLMPATDVRYKHLQPLVAALHEATEAKKHAHLFVYSHLDQRFELVLSALAPARSAPAVHFNRRHPKRTGKTYRHDVTSD